ncbi:MAG: ribosome rescue protein RqcH [Halobacteria archaeon]
MKKEMSSVDVAAAVKELREYSGAKFDKFYQYGDDKFRVKMRDFDAGRLELIMEFGELKRIHLASEVEDAPERPPDLPKLMRKRLGAGELVDVTQFDFDRIVEIEGERGDGERYTIVAEFFGDGNLSFLDGDGKVMRSLETVRLRTRQVAPGEEYEYPESRLSPLEMDFEEFLEVFRESDTDVVRTLASQLNFGGLYAEEICLRAGIEKEKPLSELDREDRRGIYEGMVEVFEPLIEKDMEPHIVLTEEKQDGRDRDQTPKEDTDECADRDTDEAREKNRDGDTDEAPDDNRNQDRNVGMDVREFQEADPGEIDVVDVLPFELESYGEKEKVYFDSFNGALDAYFSYVEDSLEKKEEQERDSGLEEEIKKQEMIIEQQEGAIEGFEREEKELREKAESLYRHYGLVEDVLETVGSALKSGFSEDEIEDRIKEGQRQGVGSAEAVESVSSDSVTLELDGREVDVRLDGDVESNASRLYNEAKEIAGKRDGAREAMEEKKTELKKLRERRRSRKDTKTSPGVSDGDESGSRKDGCSGPVVPRGELWYERFRWFRTSDDFLVIGGRNADQNDEIYERYMEKYDLFFHSEAHGGPITVLKTSEPDEPSGYVDVPERSKREAARFAVSYSSVWEMGHFSGDAYSVPPEQVSKTPESGEYIEKGSVVVRGDREYFRDVPVDVAVGLRLDNEAGVIGGPLEPVVDRSEFHVELEPGMYSQNDMAKKVYRRFREHYEGTGDENWVRKLASPDLIQKFLPAAGSRIKD